jgi:hypothetical protein
MCMPAGARPGDRQAAAHHLSLYDSAISCRSQSAPLTPPAFQAITSIQTGRVAIDTGYLRGSIHWQMTSRLVAVSGAYEVRDMDFLSCARIFQTWGLARGGVRFSKLSEHQHVKNPAALIDSSAQTAKGQLNGPESKMNASNMLPSDLLH